MIEEMISKDAKVGEHLPYRNDLLSPNPHSHIFTPNKLGETGGYMNEE
jgi:hypothetical protein